MEVQFQGCLAVVGEARREHAIELLIAKALGQEQRNVTPKTRRVQLVEGRLAVVDASGAYWAHLHELCEI
jgi:hypothetical protein